MKKLFIHLSLFVLVMTNISFTQPTQAPEPILPYSPSLDISAMDKSVDPCVDFYQYSCGGWIKRNPIPADQASWSVYGKLAEANQRFLWGILDDLAKRTTGRTDTQQKIGDYFAACMDEAAPERDYYFREDPRSVELRNIYVAHVARMLMLSGEQAPAAREGAAAVMRIETALAGASLKPVERRDPHNLFHKMSRAQAQQLTPAFDWNAFLAGLNLGTVQTINVTQPTFFKQLQLELNNESLDDWKAYLRWHVVHAQAPYLSKAFVVEDFDFYSRTLRGVPQLPPRWKRCVRLVDRQLGEA